MMHIKQQFEDRYVDDNEEGESGSEESESSEIERLDTATPVESYDNNPTETPTERGIAKTKKAEELILKIIGQTKALGSNTLDLGSKGVRQIPNELLELSQLEYLYLEGNELCSLPDDFFDKLPNLVWLDIRRNGLLRLPSVYTGRHQNLRNLLLEGNNLRSLPLELGLIKSLNGLNISGNPIEFPPGEIIEKGTNEILKFLREMLLAKSQGRLTTSLNGGENGEDSSSSSEDWQDERDLRDWAKIQHRSLSMEDNKSTTTKSSEFGLVPHSAELHRPVSYTEIKQEKTDKIMKAGAMGTVDRLNTLTQSVDRGLISNRRNDSSSYLLTRQSTFTSRQNTVRRQSANNSVLSWKVNPYPEPPPADYIHFKMNEERQLAKVKDFKEKTDAILQRRKDENVLKEWRHETKIKQQKRQIEIMRTGKKDYVDPVEKAPFDIDENHIKVMSNEERIKQDVKTAHERLRRQLSPASRQRVEEEKAARIKELEKKIKLHTSQMHSRRKQQKGTPQEEMEAARRDLEIVKNLQKDLLKRYQELKAWTTGVGDFLPMIAT
ncbi:leucine-rich repeat-containing protein 27-like isoform X4 [Mytilus californianus]|uniref:leucine-rich repeat-containing protein 27-like isoform X4 n=2 Tax=Mytilus californianus TaxID=6549 RepID=UPI0022484B50|nr:leucine-rich repeat-containing protein 27-like isoform X4 [Mytilus californianus]XP_052102131.1 leucine-rich repeat-containing protein 27-like isoform X4 [Mytilus californianus]